MFELNASDKLQLLQEQPPRGVREKVERAVRLCPKAPLKLG